MRFMDRLSRWFEKAFPPPAESQGANPVNRIIPQQAEDYFDEFSYSYDNAAERLEWQAPQILYNCLLVYFNKEAFGNVRMLDVGIGTGHFSALIKDNKIADQLHGIDISENMLERLKYKKIADQTHQIDVSQAPLPYALECFNLVASCGMFEYMPNPKFALSEMARVTTPGGFLAFTTMDHEPFRSLSRLRTNYHTIQQIGEIAEKLGLEVLSAQTEIAYESAMRTHTSYNFFIARKPLRLAHH